MPQKKSFIASIQLTFNDFDSRDAADDHYQEIVSLIDQYVDDKGLWDVEKGSPEIYADMDERLA